MNNLQVKWTGMTSNSTWGELKKEACRVDKGKELGDTNRTISTLDIMCASRKVIKPGTKNR